jgi:hypothetical protein
MIDFLDALTGAFWQILLELSPSLLLGLLLAGLMHVYLPTGFIHRGLSQPNLSSVVRASLIGVPLPLCSCGVIPAALGLRNEGASKGATTAFMISTPQTGADAILVNAAFLGWPFALFNLVAVFVTGLIGGVLVNHLTRPDPIRATPTAVDAEDRRDKGLVPVLRYAIFDLLGAIDLWILVGVTVASLMTILLPADYFASQSWSQGVFGMLVVLAISLPLYVCTTGSVPIAASLIAAGLPAGSALVFLMAGPATNVATFGAVYRALGGSILAIYLATVAVMSLLLGLLFDGLLTAASPMHHQHVQGVDWTGTLAAVVLIGLFISLALRRLRERLASTPELEADLTLCVDGMTCQHCVASVKRALEGCDSVDEATPDLASGLVHIRGDRLDVTALIKVIQKVGFQANTPTSKL